MPETITVAKFYSNREVSEILGCSPEYVRKLKSKNADELAGLWRNDGGDGETAWSEEGLNKLASMMSTPEAKKFCAGALTRRTQEAIAVDRAEISYQNDQDVSTRTGTEVNTYAVNPTAQGGRYDALPTKMGTAIGDVLVDNGAVQQMDNAVMNRLLKELSIGEINLGEYLK